MNLNWVPLIVLGFFNFNFPIDFYRGSVGGSVSGSVDRGSVFCRNPEQFRLLGAIRLRRYFSLTILMYHSTEYTEYDKQALAAYKSFDDCRLFTDGLTR